AGAASRPRILQVCEVFGARVIDMTAELVTLELTATHDKIDDLVGVLAPEGVLEMVRTGVVAMTRGEPTPISQRSASSPSGSSGFAEVHDAHDAHDAQPTQGTSSWPASSTTATLISV
ncbi:MAG: hypothetical protein ABI467_21960, partial [Kofleriaceae bacterium]